MHPSAPGNLSPGTSSGSLDSAAMHSVPGSSHASANTLTSSPALASSSVPASATVPTVVPSSAQSQNKSQNICPAQTSGPTNLDSTSTSRDVPPCALVTPATTSASESSTGPPTSDPPPTTTQNDPTDSQTAANTTLMSNNIQDPALLKCPCKTATKKASKPKKMCPSK